MYNIGIDIGGMSIKGGIVNSNGEIVETLVIETEKVGADTHITQIAKLVEDMLTKSNIKKSEIGGIGVGVPGSVDVLAGKVLYAPNISWVNVDIVKKLSSLTGLPVKIGNDADVATLAEVYFGSAKNYSSAVMLTLGTGVGGGIVIDNKLYDKSVASELGHNVIIVGGEPCGCGRRGCLEQYVSATALIRQTKTAMEKDKNSIMWEHAKGDINNVNGITAFASAKKGDKTANEVVDNYVFYLAQGIMNILNFLRPDVIIIGGGISNEKEYLVDKIVKVLEEYNYGFKNAPKCAVVCATLKNSAGIIGASSLFFSQL